MAPPFTVDDPIDLAPPPEWRVDAGSPEQWDEVELALGTSLPRDDKLIINVYGSGESPRRDGPRRRGLEDSTPATPGKPSGCEPGSDSRPIPE